MLLQHKRFSCQLPKKYSEGLKVQNKIKIGGKMFDIKIRGPKS
jgi:hypothetical protein